MMNAATMAPRMEPMVPRTITAKAGRSSLNASPGSKLPTVIPYITPPTPHIAPDRKALVIWTLSTLMPLLAASSGLSATALIRLPRRVLFSNRSRSNAVEKTTNTEIPL